ncbi:MAG TPA: XrtA system polysaccharide deacetylase [Vicinamibacterales bacterium]|nr:XrtA system polysaccharide deacetylase [Vicinamibacterales bacterium]
MPSTPDFSAAPSVDRLLGGGAWDNASRAAGDVLNAMTVDVEDYFQVSAFEDRVSRSQWDRFESRVGRNTERLLEMFDRAGVRATFFVLGWVAERFPGLIRQIHSGGHEIASHGFSHRLVYDTTPEEFRLDLRRARAALEAAANVSIFGYRAPSYSITRRSLWALDVLVSEGYVFDSSIYPIHHDRYGIPDWSREIQRIDRPGGSLWELPGSTVRWAGTNFPIGGGGYFRLLPYGWTRRGILRLNAVERKPAVFYLHPWEIDPEQPRIAGSGLSRMRHYRNLDKTEERLRRLLAEFRFGSVSEVLGEASRAADLAAVS